MMQPSLRLVASHGTDQQDVVRLEQGEQEKRKNLDSKKTS
jgi:hypothetical protein